MTRLTSAISVAGCALCAICAIGSVAQAHGPSQPGEYAADGKLDVRAQYEEKLVQAALLRRGFAIEPDPDGKIIEAIYIDAREIIVPGDLPFSKKLPWTFLNRLHMRTRDFIVAQELLMQVGEPFRRDVFEESGRNLRSFFILSVARLAVVQGSKPGHVCILVVTKDQWSLRFNAHFGIDQARLDWLSFSFAEYNLLGRNKKLAFEFAVDPGRYTLGASYNDPRLFGTRNFLQLTGLFYLRRDDRQLEGGLAQVAVGSPLYSLRTKLAWEARFSYQQDITRFFKGPDLALRRFGEEEVPDVYSRRVIAGSVQGTYSMGVLHKLNVTLGWRVQSGVYELPQDFPTVSAATRAAYQATLPRSESFSGPFITIETFTARFLRIKNIHTFALSEDFRLGPAASLDLRFSTFAFGFDNNFAEIAASFSNQHYARDNLLSYGANIGARVQQGIGAARRWSVPLVNEFVTAYIRETSPRFSFLRLHLGARVQLRARDLDNQRITLGADNGLRGFAPRALQGGTMYRVNAELRTTPLNLWTVHVGGVLFYDGGDAPASIGPYDPSGTALPAGFHQNVGVGVRLVLPQFIRDALRLDLAFPFERTEGRYVPRFSVEYGQAF